MPKVSGVYAIVNHQIKKIYISTSEDAQTRMRVLRYWLNENRYQDNKDLQELQRDYNKKASDFEFNILKKCRTDLNKVEVDFCKEYIEKGYYLYNKFIHIEGVACPDEYKPVVKSLIGAMKENKVTVDDVKLFIEVLK